MKINCIILDDEPLALDLIEDYVRSTPFLNLCAKCSSAVEALEAVRTQKVELAFLDIQMPMINGLELSKMLDGCAIIFTTAFGQYAIEGYKVNAVGYLLKPFSYAEFLEAANKGCNWCEMKRKAEEATAMPSNRSGNMNQSGNISLAGDTNPSGNNIPGTTNNSGKGIISPNSETTPQPAKSIIVRSGYLQKVIDLSTIVYIESIRDYQKFHLDGGETIQTLMSMKSLEESLPKEDFVRVHRSFIVNIRKVKTIERSRIIFGKERIPISDSYREAFEKRF